MTHVTHADIAGIITYLVAAQAITATEGQIPVWHDYLTHTIPNLQPEELKPACRTALTLWAQNDRTWRLDPARYAQAIHHNRRQNLTRDQQTHGPLHNPTLADHPQLEAQWTRWAKTYIALGHPRTQAAK